MQRKLMFCAPCLMGVEGLAAEELRDMGCKEVQAENGRVLFSGDEQILVRTNLWSRYAERILILLGEFPARSFEELFQGVRRLPWEEFLGKEDAFPVSGSSLSSQLHSVPDCQSIVKKAVVERLKEKYRVPWFEETGPLHRIRFRILKDRVSIMLDTSGEGLHKRGYRRESTLAPIKETLAAALVKLARLRPDGHLIDPFCGSGTLLIEGALLATNTAPGLRRHFQAELWRDSPEELWRRERERAKELICRNPEFTAEGYDLDPAAVALTLENAEKAGVSVTARVRDIRDFTADGRFGCVVCNPPYGERLLDRREAQEIARTMGKVFPPQPGWSYGIISPDEEFEALFGRPADKRRKLYNGMIKCQFYQYFKNERRENHEAASAVKRGNGNGTAFASPLGKR